MRPGSRPSLRRRLFAVLATTALACVATTAVVTLVLGAHAARAARLDALRGQADALAATTVASVRSATAPLRVFTAAAPGVPLRRAGRPRTRAVRAALRDRGPGDGTVTVGGRDLLYALRSTAAGPVVLVRPAGQQAGDVRPLGSIVALSAFAGLALAAALAALSARRLTRPIAALTRATQPVAAGTADAPLPVDGPRELAELATAFNAMSSDLATARDAERRFLMTVSHELRTPLTSIRGYAEALADERVPAAEVAAVLEAEALRLDRLVGDLLELATVGSSRFAVADEDIDLAEIARSAVSRHAVAAAGRGLALTARTEPEARGRGDATRLLQAVSNLVENALRVTPAGGEVTVLAAPAQLAVADSGPGLADEDRARAFERFRLHDSAGAAAGSSGLGLALVAELMAAMGGSAAAEPEPAGGTRFVLRLRRAQMPPVA